jgi:hypothetical protein
VPATDGVHDLAEQVLVGEVISSATIASPLDDLGESGRSRQPPSCGSCHRALRRIPVVRCRSSSVLTRRAKGLPCSSKLRNRSRRPFSKLVEPSSFNSVEARDIVIDQLGLIAVFWQTTMKHGGTLMPSSSQSSERLFVVPIERFECCLQLGGKLSGSSSVSPRFFFGIFGPDVFPQVAEHGHLLRRGCCPPQEHGATSRCRTQ